MAPSARHEHPAWLRPDFYQPPSATTTGTPVRHFVLHADQLTLRQRIEQDPDMGPSEFRLAHLAAYAEAARTWLRDEAGVIDIVIVSPELAARTIVDAVH